MKKDERFQELIDLYKGLGDKIIKAEEDVHIEYIEGYSVSMIRHTRQLKDTDEIEDFATFTLWEDDEPVVHTRVKGELLDKAEHLNCLREEILGYVVPRLLRFYNKKIFEELKERPDEGKN